MRMRKGPWLTALLLLASSLSFSHDDLRGTRYVAMEGVDAGDCDHAHDPCRTIAYAIEHAPTGATVKVAEGIFPVEGLSVDDVLHGKTGVLGGYSTADEFKHQDPDLYLTRIYGLQHADRDRLMAHGLRLMVDRVMTRDGRGGGSIGGVSARSEPQAVRAAAANCVQGLAGAFPCRNIDLLAQLRLVDLSTRPNSMSNVWGFVDLDDDREYAVVGVSNATVVIDVTDPENPREVGSVPGNGNAWREVKVFQFFDAAASRHRAYAYITTEALGGGLQVIELSDVPNSVSLANTVRDFQTSHTLYVSNVNYATNVAIPGRQAFLYVAGSNINVPYGSFLIFDLTDPVSPRLVTRAPGGTGYMHDSTSLFITDNRTTQCDQGHNPCEVLVDFNESTVDLWDVTIKSAPVRLSATGYPEARYTHSGWPTEDQQYIVVHDELDELLIGINTHIYTLDIGDLRTPRLITSYIGPDTTTDHNGYAKGDRYYVSHYRRGLVVFDLANPEDLREVGSLDTFLSPAENVAVTEGAWGVYPFLPSGNILVSDIDNGLFVLRDNTRDLGANVGRLGFIGNGVVVAESAGGASVILRRTGGIQGAVSVDYATRDGSAVAGSDYTATSGTLTWAAGDDVERTIDIPIVDETAEEGNEQFSLALSNLTGGATIDGSTEIAVTISANDAPRASGGGGGGGRIDLLSLLLAAGALYWAARRRGNSLARPAARSVLGPI